MTLFGIIYFGGDSIDTNFTFVKNLPLLVNERFVYVSTLVLIIFILRYVHSFFTKEKISVVKGLVSVIYISSMVIFSMTILALSLSVLFHTANPREVINATYLLQSVDNLIFPDYLIFNLYDHDMFLSIFLEKLITVSYRSLPIVFAIFFSILVMSDRKYFRKAILAFFLSPFIAFIFWALIPAGSPEGIYVQNIFGIEHPDDISSRVMTLDRGEYINGNIDDINKAWIDPENFFINTSHFPSMHIVWNFMIAYFSMHFRKILGVFTIPYVIFGSIGTFYLFQHFFADVIFGIILSILIIYIVDKIVDYFDSKEDEEMKKLLFYAVK